MGAVKEHFMERYGDMQTLQRLADIKIKLLSADILADDIRDRALRDYSSDEPYETAAALSARIASALSMVEIMLEDFGVPA